MKEIKVKCISDNLKGTDVDKISDLLNTFDRQNLAFTPWPEFFGKSKVYFAIAHNSSNIFLKYYRFKMQLNEYPSTGFLKPLGCKFLKI